GPLAAGWSIGNTSVWLNVSATNGTLAVSGTTNITVNLSAAASSLAAGDYAGTVDFTNQLDGVKQSSVFTLVVQPPAPLVVTPAQGFVSTGYVGGPFTVTSQSVTLSNTGPLAAGWSIGNTSVWLNVSATNGTLAVSGTTNITVSLSAAASSLAAG